MNQQPGNDGKGNPLTLHVYNNTMHGFLRLTADKDLILCESLGVDETTNKTTSLVTKNVVATKGATQASRTWTGDVISPKSPQASKTAEAKKKK